MFYSLKKETGHERPKDKSTNKKNYEIIPTPCSTYTWDLVRALESASPASCKTPATFIDSIRPNN